MSMTFCFPPPACWLYASSGKRNVTGSVYVDLPEPMKNHKIANNTTTTEAKEEINVDFGMSPIS
jgi:hypothetical protein